MIPADFNMILHLLRFILILILDSQLVLTLLFFPVAVANTSIMIYLHGIHGTGGLLQAEITTLPSRGAVTDMIAAI